MGNSMSAETMEHKKIKEMVTTALSENFGIGLREYPDCGNVADGCIVTMDGIKIFVEVVWTPTENNFNRDLNILHRSDAGVKIFIVNPKLLQKPVVVREFVKTQMAEMKKGSAVSDMIDGLKILNDPDFINGEFIATVKRLIATQRVKLNTKVKPKEKLKHSKRILLTRSDYQGLDHWFHDTLMTNLLLHGSKRLETICLMKHFETGYNEELWMPLMEYKKVLEKYGRLKTPALDNPQESEVKLVNNALTQDEEQRVLELKRQFLQKLDEVIFSVQNEVPLKGLCDICTQ